MSRNPFSALAAWFRQPGQRHRLLLLYWLIYLPGYVLSGRLHRPVHAVCTAIALDGRIPFVEAFIGPYLLWILILMGLVAYGVLREPRMFTHLMWFLMLTFTAAVLTFWLFPTYAGVRPAEVPGRGVFAALTRFVYWIDADANACPSEHIIGVFAIVFAVWDSRALSRPWIKGLTVLTALAIIASTALVKQHAVLDILAALPISLIGGFVCFWLPNRKAASGSGEPI